MSNEIKVTVRGWVGSEPVRHVVSDGKTFARFRVASTPRVRDGITGEYRDGATEWFTVKAWKDLAENALASLHKGTPVLLHGTLSSDTWQSERGERTTNVIRLDAVGPDLSHGTATFVRTVRSPAADEAGDDESDAAPGAPADVAAGLTGPGGVRFSGSELPDEEEDEESEEEDEESIDYQLAQSV